MLTRLIYSKVNNNKWHCVRHFYGEKVKPIAFLHGQTLTYSKSPSEISNRYIPMTDLG